MRTKEPTDRMAKTVLTSALPYNSVWISDALRQALRVDIRQRLVTALMCSGEAVTDPKLDRLPVPVRYPLTGALAARYSTVWRAFEVRLQSYGPQAAWRKLIVVGPTLVRPGRLGW
ncbi:hypothetical protein LMA00_15350 [Burkholderia ambifaria]|uniref:hypothetical protein n=1 Tax=Burkholderia ambifaria TaxID=152480 RepID=UPI001E5B7EC6|nr:hypothetical protein [Burkholderia ambifaria]UEP48014.1 hypothetical protein LMA00_15350 [Burkholderia ambifaria]